jgi:6-phosphogluconolactonase
VKEPELIVVPTAVFAERAAEWVATSLAQAVAARAHASVALAGGNTPLPIYRELSGTRGELVPWSQLDIFFGDERAVPPEHPDSNFGQVSTALGARLRQAGRVERMRAEIGDPEAAAAAYAGLLPSAFDLILLGMGEDGHIASLFPQSSALFASTRRVVVTAGPKPPRVRLTLTPSVLALAHRIVVLVTGAAKAGMVARALATSDDVAAVPARLVREAVWILDEAAAAAIPERR